MSKGVGFAKIMKEAAINRVVCEPLFWRAVPGLVWSFERRKKSKNRETTTMNSHYVYIIAVFKDGEITAPVKVGISRNPDARIRGLQTAAPYQLRLVRKFATPSQAVAKDIENCFHDTQREHHAYGEWFNLPPSEACAIILLQIRWALELFTEYSEDEIDECMKRVEAA